MQLTDPAAIARYLRRDTALHLYALGDLDPFFWHRTRWWGLGEPLEVVGMVYDHPMKPTLMALCGEGEAGRMNELLEQMAVELPAEVYAHLSHGVKLAGWACEDHGVYDKMCLVDPARVESVADDGVEDLGPSHTAEVERFYARCYPNNWFDPRMLETEAYVGVRQPGELVSLAREHVLSTAELVAALGNIATDAGWRGRGLGRRVTAAVCRRLLGDVDTIGLNVEASNGVAIRCYERLGFERVASYREARLRRR